MSYLNPPRLHFAGTFQAAPSTVNNDPLHFNNATFKDIYQTPGPGATNGWWNPGGDAAWRLIGCKVTGVWLGHDQPSAITDPIGTCLIADSDQGPPAKIVDLDPEQQLVSEVWGLHVRITRADGTTLLRARYQVAAFSDIWDRTSGGGGDIGAGAAFQSVLTDLEWGDVSASSFLEALKQAASDGLLSIKFNVDGYNMDSTSPKFTRGRIVGTIGPSSAKEPRHFVVGRHFMAAAGTGGNFFAPAGRVNFCTAIVDATAGKIVLDLGNALPTTAPGAGMANLGTLGLAALAQSPVLLGTFDYRGANWYEKTAGVVMLPAGRKLTSTELATVQQSPLAVTATDANGNSTVVIGEPSNGTYVRADRYVYRLNPGDSANVRLFASQWGQPYAEARVIAILDPSQLQAQAGSPLGQAPPVAIPTDVVDFPARLVTDSDGIAELAISVGDPGPVRDFIDGQVYGVRPILEENLDFGAGYNLSPWEFVSLLVWSGFVEETAPTWFGSMEPIFRQYANLYPVMEPIVNLKDYDSISANVDKLLFVLRASVEDPVSMPVTRDLSAAKRAAMVRWLSSPGPDGKPLKGTLKPPVPAAMAAAEAAAAPQPAEPMRGGKAMAASRRLMLRNRVPGAT